jgi:hypothetical protein
VLKDINIQCVGEENTSYHRKIFVETNDIHCTISYSPNHWNWTSIAYKVGTSNVHRSISSMDVLKRELNRINKITITTGLTLQSLLEPVGIKQTTTKCDNILRTIWYKEDKIVSYLHTPNNIFLIVKSARNLIKGYVVIYDKEGWWNDNKFEQREPEKVLKNIEEYRDFVPDFKEIDEDTKFQLDLIKIKGGN